MIKKRTVFVLGAGASMPYAFPSGAQLRQSICSQALTDGSGLSEVLFRECGIPVRELQRFGQEFQQSKQRSIDAFLSRRDCYATIGKLSIAYELCRREISENLYATGNEDDWYGELWHSMTTDIGNAMALAQNQIRFITFNYDRSLEWMLHCATKGSFGVDDEAARLAWGKIKILHVYGALGDLDPSGRNGRPYEPNTSRHWLEVAADGIRVIPEARDEDEKFTEARDWFSWAEQVCFLGFSFDPLNMSRLDLTGVMEAIAKRQLDRPMPEVFASTLGMTEKEVTSFLYAKLPYAATLQPIPDRCLMTMRRSGVLH